MQNLLPDLRFAFRQLAKSPGFTATAILMLAFGIGATTAIFSIVEGVPLRPLPFPDSSRLMVLADRIIGAEVGISRSVARSPEESPPRYVLHLLPHKAKLSCSLSPRDAMLREVHSSPSVLPHTYA